MSDALMPGDGVPGHYLPLIEICRQGSRKPNVVRKHYVDGWFRAGLACKGEKGTWFVDPKVLDRMKPGVPIDPAKGPEGRGHADAGTRGRADLPFPASPCLPVSASPLPPVPASPRPRVFASPFPRRGFIGAEKHLQDAAELLLAVDPIPWQLLTALTRLAAECREHARGGQI